MKKKRRWFNPLKSRKKETVYSRKGDETYDNYYEVLKDTREIEQYIEGLLYEEWKEVAFQVLNCATTVQRDLMRFLYVKHYHGDTINERVLHHAYELSEAVHGLPEILLEVASAESYEELQEAFDVGESFIKYSHIFLARTIHCLFMLDYERYYPLIEVTLPNLIGFNQFIERKMLIMDK